MESDTVLRRWFVDSVLPLERELERYLSRHCREADDIADLRQETYERALAGATGEPPRSTRAFVFTIARNVLIDRARRAKVVSFEQIAEIEPWDGDWMQTDRALTARDELRRAMEGLEHLPPRCREVVRLRKVEGLNIRETAARLGVGHHTVERQLTLGLRAMADYMLGGEGRIVRALPGRATRKGAS